MNKDYHGLSKANISEAGFTLMELVVYIGVFSILVGVMTTAFLSILNTQLAAETTNSTTENGKYLLQRLSNDIERSQSIAVPATPGSSSTYMQLTINNINYTYALDANGNFQITDTTDGLGPYNLNDYDVTVSSVSFNRIGNLGGKNTIQMSFTVNSTTTSKANPSQTFSTTAGPR